MSHHNLYYWDLFWFFLLVHFLALLYLLVKIFTPFAYTFILILWSNQDRMCKIHKLVFKSICNIYKKLRLDTRLTWETVSLVLDLVTLWDYVQVNTKRFLRVEIYTRLNQLFMHEEAKSWDKTKDSLFNSVFLSLVSAARSFPRTTMPKTWNIWKQNKGLPQKQQKR